jgi:hypothetical protein
MFVEPDLQQYLVVEPYFINAGSKVKRKADEKCNTLIHFPICSKTGTGGGKGCTQTWRCGETFADESS